MWSIHFFSSQHLYHRREGDETPLLAAAEASGQVSLYRLSTKADVGAERSLESHKSNDECIMFSVSCACRTHRRCIDRKQSYYCATITILHPLRKRIAQSHSLWIGFHQCMVISSIYSVAAVVLVHDAFYGYVHPLAIHIGVIAYSSFKIGASIHVSSMCTVICRPSCHHTQTDISSSLQ